MRLPELLELLKSADTVQQIDERKEEIAQIIPKTRIMFGYDQKNSAHPYDLWMHSLYTVTGLPKDIDDGMVYLAALLHDIGKPDCRTAGKREGDTNMHYYGHPQRSMEIVRDEVIPELIERGEVISPDERRRLIYYVEYHDDRISLRPKHLLRHLRMGASMDEFKKLMKLQVSDARAHVLIPVVVQRIEICEAWDGEYGEETYARIKEGKI